MYLNTRVHEFVVGVIFLCKIEDNSQFKSYCQENTKQ